MINIRSVVTRCVAGVGFLVAAGASGEANYPAYYPDDYRDIVKASKSEDKLLIYSNIAEYNWQPVLQGFQEKYPWIKIESIDLGPSTSFERYYSESSVDKRTTDLIVTGAPDGWYRFAEPEEEVLEYASPESEYLPRWSMPWEGVYSISADPMIIIYNKILLDEDDYPDSLEDIEELVEDGGSKYRNKLTTYNATSHSFAYDLHWATIEHLGDEAWPLFDSIGAYTRSESGGATMVEKVTSGEYLAGYFVSGITVFPRMAQKGRDKVLGWSLIEDGTPVFMRNMAITRKGKSPNSAKLMLDYILSHEGQVALGNGGLTPYRDDVKDSEIPYMSYQAIVEEIGQENVVMVDFDEESYRQRDDFIARWKAAFHIE